MSALLPYADLFIVSLVEALAWAIAFALIGGLAWVAVWGFTAFRDHQAEKANLRWLRRMLGR